MTQYIYAIPDGDWAHQHLLPALSGGSLCGTKAKIWTTASPASRPFPGVALCDECKQARKQRSSDEKDEELRKQKESLKTYWTREARQ